MPPASAMSASDWSDQPPVHFLAADASHVFFRSSNVEDTTIFSSSGFNGAQG